ncbi:carboxymuconolactone decarboxylase family protein [Methanococcus voltae]|jgi:alkylhydroperoxidase/carboxymuconolactone decarboxylase family protein YurZ|uniref:Alkylhydroperoxidase/carboxymuconolactone decarboxylase family protein YurZ n=2 Tax=Methanococcus voltae TaxID=2188 RepID=A0A8J7UT14_METVO|nr:carboxymuconolactone decarboxylase family protein [Methanococcus voltae]MBP2171841.1 alkylhydroperoxidase/carboxymuconolactone decarboxylase family protein YurZ [Methanococcus voltae]MBP2201204.1 alkylhydroperoxidase/carboxymuconolactone decarboxylase family protein YurZ [Methanococcus voltae]MCS3921927.1 alkylhydroperoxidase/carboxymuconolactone decarboxylase family protein YurZ [Methanococcus voltae PS]
MKQQVFYGKGMPLVKKENPELYDAIVALNDAVFNGKVLDYKTQKLIAIAITAASGDKRGTFKQIYSGMNHLAITHDEVMDALNMVLLTSGMPPFIKAVRILEKVEKEIEADKKQCKS